jgi:hypothetical protein
MKKRYADMSGQRYGRLVAVEYADSDKDGNARWRCRCDCGGETISTRKNLKSGSSASCGCLRDERALAATTKHGMTKSPEYVAWKGMKVRCYRKSEPSYHRYGGRGITVCRRWREGEGSLSGFECFFADMGSRPSPEHSVDRYPDKDGNYEPRNCRWATPIDQGNNAGHNVVVEFRGRSQTLSQWARELGFPRHLPSQRLRRGWSVERTLTAPVIS